MNKLLLVGAAIGTALLLSACEPTADERAKLSNALPAGCDVYEVGSYGDIKSLVIVKCEGKTTTTANGSWTQSHGKTSSTYQFASVVIE